MKLGLTIGWMGQTGAGPTRFAERAVDLVATLGADAKGLLVLNKETGRVSLHDHDDDLPAPVYFARGVSRISDPDDLADDLMEEAQDAGLLTVSDARKMLARRAKRMARRD
jgi:hypothetical protein